MPRTLTLTVVTYGCFAVLALGIVVNALLAQSIRHPDPLFRTRVLPQPVEARAPAPSIAERALTAAVQEKLGELNYYSGQIDGLAGPETRAAIKAYRTRTGIGGGDRPSTALLEALERLPVANDRPVRVAAAEPDSTPVARPDPRPRPGTALRADETADPAVLAVQNALARAAYGPLVADGVMGRQTGDAIRRFQLDNGMPLTGRIDDRLVRRLIATGALDEAPAGSTLVSDASN